MTQANEMTLEEAKAKIAAMQDLINDLADPFEMIQTYWNRDEDSVNMCNALYEHIDIAKQAMKKMEPFLTWR
jgi:hypothetical protein